MAERNQQELAERVDAASAKARELKAQLEATQQRIADLSAETEANRASSMAQPSVLGHGSTDAPLQESNTSHGYARHGTENYREQGATRQLLRQKTAYREKRGRVILMAGWAIPFVALLTWGALTMIHFAANEPIPPLAGKLDALFDLGSPDGGQLWTNPETATLSVEEATGKLNLEGAVPLAGTQDLAATQHQIARLSVELEASDKMIARLRDELAVAQQAVETTHETTSVETKADAKLQRRELMLAATVSSARVAALQKELNAAQQQMGDLSKAASTAEEEAVRLREELAVRQQVAAATKLPKAPSDQNPTADQKGANQTQGAEDVEAAPEIEEILTAAEMSSNPVTTETAALRDTVSTDDLLLEPGRHFGREVVVTGSVVWLLQRYWLQSDSGHMSMLVDVEDLQLYDRNKLKDAVVKIEFLARVRARITGIIERQGSENYRIAATELVFVE